MTSPTCISSSVAAGVRRIEAVTGTGVLEYIDQINENLAETAANLKVNGAGEVPQKSAAVMAELKNKDKEIEELNNKLAQMRVESLLGCAKEICGLRFVCAKLEGIAPASLRIMGDHIKFKAPDAIALLASVNEGKASVLVVCGLEALKEGAHAGKIVKEISSIELSLRLYLSIIAVSKGKFLSLGMFRVTVPEVVSKFLL